MTERGIHAGLAAVALALLKAGRSTEASLREMLLRIPLGLSDAEQVDRLLELANVVRASINGSLSEARASIEKGLDLGVMPIPICSLLYPPTLRLISDAPPLIHVKGELTAFAKLPGVSVVGTRKATVHGMTIAERLAVHLGDAGFVVVSGLALGIDAAAHEGALKSDTPTIAVLAHGLEKASPKANSQLAARILEAGGAWVSEHKIGTPARPEYFVHRNRIQVGLSCASIIVEGEERSGSATQAEFCLRNRRTLFAVLPEEGAMVSTHHQLPKLLVESRGAIPITSRQDYETMLEMIKKKAADLTSGSLINAGQA